MKFKTLAISLVTVIAFAPAFALAQTTTTDNTAAEIAALQQLIVILTQELQQLIAQKQQGTATTPAPSNVSTIPTVTTAPTPQPSADYSSYTPISMDVYGDDPSSYVGSDVVVEGMVNSFMPKGGTGGSTNYIQIINPFDQPETQMQLEIDDPTTYSASVSAFQNQGSPIYQFVRAYGVGVPDQELTETSLLGSSNVMVPVVNVTRLDQCIHGSMNTTVLTGTSFDDNFTCTDWQTVAQASS